MILDRQEQARLAGSLVHQWSRAHVIFAVVHRQHVVSVVVVTSSCCQSQQITRDHFLGEDLVHIEFDEFFQLFNQDVLDKSLVSAYVL
jgi:hypothetical protein